jgi:hydroxyacyl-ACP dehydratase HTD2-like protein with hotdog domain
MSSRNVRPLFVNRPFQVCGEPSPDNKTAKLWVVDQDGAPTLIAEAEIKWFDGGIRGRFSVSGGFSAH